MGCCLCCKSPRRPSRSHDEQSTHLIDGDPTNREAVRLGESSVLNLDAQSIFSAVAQSDFGSTLPDSVCRLIAHFGDFIVDSHILNCDEQGDLLTLLEEQFVNRANVELRVLYRGSRDGFRIQPFLNKAKDKENTLMLIHNDHHYKFGGYTQIPWSDDREYHSDETAFLYQIRPQCTVFPLLPEREHWAVMHDTSQSTFPFFGNWGELVLYQDCNLNSNSNCFIWDGRETFDFKANDVCGGNTHPHGPKYWGFRVIEVELLQII